MAGSSMPGPAMRVVRAGFAPLKGARHAAYDEVLLDAHGPVGDRDWCLIDIEREQVLRSVRVPLMAVRVDWEHGSLTVTLPDGRSAEGAPEPAGERVTADYWGRPVTAELYGGPAADLLSGQVGGPVRLARVPRGGVVYGAPVSLVGTASMRDAAARLGDAEAGAQPDRLRATFVVETTEPYVEDTWCGSEVRIGEAVIRVNEPIGRCGVINKDPLTGESDARLLKALASYRPSNADGEPLLAVDAVVVVPGRVRVGDEVVPG